jgi:hypothetical protein
MKKLKFIRYLFVCCFLINTVSMQCMLKCVNYFISLPTDIVKIIFSYSNKHTADEKKAIVKTIKNVMALSCTCKKFRQTLDCKIVGEIFKKYSDEAKKYLLKKIVFRVKGYHGYRSLESDVHMQAIDYLARRYLFLGFINAGAPVPEKLIDTALYYDDIELISLLCEKKINLCAFRHNIDEPLFFNLQTKRMAKLCEKNNIDLHMTSISCPNILWKVVSNSKISSNVLEHLLARNIAILPRIGNGNSLLHKLVISCTYSIKDINDHINKGKLLLKKQPDLINTLNNDKETPLDVAKGILKILKSYGSVDSIDNIDQIIKFLEDNDRKTSSQRIFT